MRSRLAETPDGVAAPGWVADTANAAADAVAARGQVAPFERQQRRRATIETALAVKLLDAHLRNRVQLMIARPTDLSGLSHREAALLVRAMAAAGHADGGLEVSERQRLFALARTGIPDEAERQRLLAEIETPPSLEQLVRMVETPGMAERFYAVSASVIRRDRPACRAYLAYLATRLDLPGDVVLRIDREVDMAGIAG